MRRRIASLVALLTVGAVIVSCGDDARNAFPTSPKGPGARRADVSLGTCTTLSNLQALVYTAFAGGSPNPNSVLGKLNNLDKDLKKGDIAGAQDKAREIVAFVQKKAEQGTLGGTHAQVQALISGVLCYVGLSPDTFLVLPSDAPQVFLANGGQSGVSLQANTVTQPTLITVTQLDAPPLDTKLDQYPGFITLTQSSALTKPAIVGVCASTSVPASVLPHLRLGHQTATGFEVTPAADPGFLNCPAATAQNSRLPGWLQKLASIVTPKPLYATQEFEAFRGVAGTATEFSPFAPVDVELEFRGGVSGTATELLRTRMDSLKLGPSGTTPTPGTPATLGPLTARTPRAPGARVNTVVAGACTAVDALIGGNVEPECRPGVKLTTHLGTILQNVPVGWAIGTGGGVVAPEASVTRICGTFAANAATTTDVNGKAGACWTLGSTPGANTVVATPTAGGDVPAGVIFSPASITFTAAALQITPTAGATGGSFPYDGLAHTGSGTCSHGLEPALSYGGGPAPANAGTYTLTVTCGAGNPLYVTVTATASIEITAAVTTTAVTCPPSVVFTGSALTPCTALVTGPGLSQSVTPTYTGNVNVGTATANASYAAGGNYQGSSGSATFSITPAATGTSVSCPASVVYTGTARTPCTAMTTGPGLSVGSTVVHTNNVNVGTANASAAFPAGGNYQGSVGSANFQITPAATTASVSCPATVQFTGSTVTPCTGSATGPGLSVSVTPTYLSNVVGTATANVNYPGGGNYQSSSASKTFQIRYVQEGCFASPITNSMPSSSSYSNPKKGTSVKVKCRLEKANGYPVTTATGNLLVQDKGTNGLSSPVTVVNRTNTFTLTNYGDDDGMTNDVYYSYLMPTSPTAFLSGHYYFVTATWNDGSTTTGWFYLKP